MNRNHKYLRKYRGKGGKWIYIYKESTLSHDPGWKKDFPKVLSNTTVKYLKSRKDYDKAKKGLDVKAAVNVINEVVNEKKIKQTLSKYNPKDTIVCAVHAIEVQGHNYLPTAYAAKISNLMGFKLDDNIVQANVVGRTKKNAYERLVAKPKFSGNVIKGKKYILVDDVIGQGGTINELRKYIEKRGGEVVHVSSLAVGIFAATLPISDKTKGELIKKYGKKGLSEFLKKYNITDNIDSMTEKDGRLLLNNKSMTIEKLSKKLDEIVDKLKKG